MNEPMNTSLVAHANSMSLRDALELAKSVLKNTSPHDVINVFSRVRSPVHRRAATYIRSSGDRAPGEQNAIADFAEHANVSIGVYFYDRPGELGALALIAERRSDFDVLLVAAAERHPLEHNDAFMRAVSGAEVIWVPEAESSRAMET